MSFRILHYSDPHFGASNPRASKVAQRRAHELAPELMVISGDFAMHGRRWEFREAARWLEGLPEPRFVIPGNHDVPGLNQPIDRFFAPFRRDRRFICETEQPQTELGEIGKMVSINSTTPFGLHLDWSLGLMSPVQGSLIKKSFANSRMRQGGPGILEVGLHEN